MVVLRRLSSGTIGSRSCRGNNLAMTVLRHTLRMIDTRTPSFHDPILGCLLGGAIGDAWGGPYEGALPQEAPAFPTSGRLSDDTQLTTATCESIIEHAGVDPAHIAGRFRAWFEAGRIRGLGASTMKALRDLGAGAHWALAGAKGERAAGNGAAMRIAPLAFLLDPVIDADRTLIRDVCRITHQHDENPSGRFRIVRSPLGIFAANKHCALHCRPSTR